MKKIHLKLGVLALAASGLLTTAACSSDDHNYLKKDDKENPIPEDGEEEEGPDDSVAAATLKVEIVSVGEESVTFKLAAENAKKVYYLIQEKGVEATAELVQEQGIAVDNLVAEQTAEGLDPDTEYVLYAVALNAEDIATFNARGIEFKTQKKVDVSITLTNIDATHERVMFTLTPVGAVKARYMVVEKSTVEGREVTAEEVLEEGSNIMNLNQPSNLKPKVAHANTDYVIFAAGLSATGATVIVSEEVRTKDESEAPVDEELKVMTNMNFVGDEVGHTVAYYLYLSNDQLDVQFTVAAAQADEDILKEGRYIRNASQGPGRPGADEVGKSFKILNKGTGALDTDIDYGEIRITKTSATEYKVEIDMVRRTDVTKRFKALFNGVPVRGEPRP
ncbi:hypothetical protein [Myroides fluvii]|uniref:hypothetical protein n=1 Tax=Myroides fluvii TaxID=2572594 RepID=UPI00131B1AA8|nr:hypothetical protein [Myroides fluvii]